MNENNKLNDLYKTISFFKEEVNKFVENRNWKIYHTPKNLVQAINCEAGELSQLLLFKDYTRECIKEFEKILNVSDFSICESDKYDKLCPIYMTIIGKKKPCKFFKKCYAKFTERLDYIHSNLLDSYEIRVDEIKNFCFNESNRKNCKIYQLYEKGIDDIPKDFIPSGSIHELIPEINR